jgi:AAA domain/DnaB-like helicase N terminal domain
MEQNGAIFGAMQALRRRDDPLEPVTLAAELERLGILDRIGGKGRLSELATMQTSASNVGHYAALVLEAARGRNVYRMALSIQRAATNGGLAMHPELIDGMVRVLDEARVLPGEPGVPTGPVFLTAHDFAARQFAPPEPLLGTDDMPIIAVGSFNLFAGRPGAGKTTALLDACCHMAAGVPWPPRDTDKAPEPWPVSRPLRIAFIENEGPQESFRAKLHRKLECFPHSVREGALMIQTARWGTFSFADHGLMNQVAAELDAHEIDLVVGDPLASLGLEGVGSPAETLAFVQLLRPLGLGAHRAFLFLHHFREKVEKGEDELQRISGAWGGHLDTLLSLSATHSEDQLRLNYPKVRWARSRAPHAVILGKVYNAMAFEAIAEEGDAALLEPRISQALADSRASGHSKQGWQTADEIRAVLGARRVDTKQALEGARHLFKSVTGDGAKALGAKSGKAILWGLADWPEGPAPDSESLDELASQGSLDDSFEPSDGIPF